jgi:beta-N-acetylhexosaminidase
MKRSKKHAKKHSSMLFVSMLLALPIIILCSLAYFFIHVNNEANPKITESSISSEQNKQKVTAQNRNGKNESIRAGKENTADEAPATFFQTEGNLEQKIDHLIATMSLREKIGQLIVVGFPSTQPDENIKRMIREYKVGGVILYDRNMETPEQVASLTNALQDLAMENTHKIPLIVSIDQEGGQIVRMRKHVSPIPSQQALGRNGDAKTVYQTAYRTGKELAAMGIQVNFAPVLDLSATDSRSFGTDPSIVSVLGRKVVTGLIDAGVAATLKHFPGNGRSNVDPHNDTSAVQAEQWDLESKDILPFRHIIENVDNSRFFVMVTHIKYPVYDKENPASLSPAIIQELLRKKLGYQGIVVTDDLEMGAVNKYFTYEDLGYKALEAGADLLLVCHTFDSQRKVIDGIWNAVQTGKLPEERINEALKRVLRYKLAKFTSIQTIHVNPMTAKQLVGNQR